MNDQRINNLVRMAMEVDELEANAQAPNLRLVGAEDEFVSAPSARRGWWVGAGLAVAAGLALALVLPAFMGGGKSEGDRKLAGPVITIPKPVESSNDTKLAHVLPPVVHSSPTQPATTQPAIHTVAQERTDPGAVERCIVVAIYRDDRGQMHCVKSKPHEWSDNRCLGEITQQELRCVSVGQACSSSADHALMVALAGPQRSLPKTDADAVGLANCILGSPCENDARCYAHAAAECVPPEVSVKIETVASSR